MDVTHRRLPGRQPPHCGRRPTSASPGAAGAGAGGSCRPDPGRTAAAGSTGRLAGHRAGPEARHHQTGWASGEYERAVSELARLTSILGQARTTDELPPEDPGIVEFGDEVVVEFAAGDTERFLVVDPIEAPLDDVRISVESPLAQALVGRRVGEQV